MELPTHSFKTFLDQYCAHGDLTLSTESKLAKRRNMNQPRVIFQNILTLKLRQLYLLQSKSRCALEFTLQNPKKKTFQTLVHV